MPWKVLITAPYILPVIDSFIPYLAENDITVVIAKVEERLEEDELLPLLDDIDGVVCGDDRFTARVIDAAPKLRVIAKWGTGVDSIDPVSAARRGIRICRTPNAFTEPVADTVLGYMLCFARNLPFMDRAMKAGEWEKIPGRALNECTLGVVGIGAVGSAVLRRAAPFGMKLLGTDIREIERDHVQALNVSMVSLDELLEQSDFVSLNCDLTETSHHLISRDQLAAMKDTAVLINTSRGSVVDEGALVVALQSGEIAGAGMDVFEHEPLSMDNPLLALDNALIAPHNSNSSPIAWERVHESTLRQLIEGLKETQ